ncbi:kelch repeat and BTB domain-containing protein 4-like [Hypanus sabinus]|uniref:kelch repeat and BTB domain-containing protein 4-like n=1 Tax=Hypanus sabinus TaxID=79690 RepID=UPI0028C40E41|nr:kelch repeat and BTB domain-containing protein 4-like [Hypanus sabinus]
MQESGCHSIFHPSTSIMCIKEAQQRHEHSQITEKTLRQSVFAQTEHDDNLAPTVEGTRTHSLAVSLHCDDDAISVSGQNRLRQQITAACKRGSDPYVVGGPIPQRMWKCNTETMDWEQCASLPRYRLQDTLVSIPSEDAIYSLGGKTLQDTPSSAVIIMWSVIMCGLKLIIWRLQCLVLLVLTLMELSIYWVGNRVTWTSLPNHLISFSVFDMRSRTCQLKSYHLPFTGHIHDAIHKDLIFIAAERDSLVCYNPLLDSFTRLRFTEVWSRVPSLWKTASCNGCIYVFRNKCKKGDAKTLKWNPAASVVSVINEIEILATSFGMILTKYSKLQFLGFNLLSA